MERIVFVVVFIAAAEGSDVAVVCFFIALLIVFNLIQRYCLNKPGRHTTRPLTGGIAGGNKGVEPHGLSAVYHDVSMFLLCHLTVVIALQQVSIPCPHMSPYVISTLCQMPVLCHITSHYRDMK